MRSLQEFVFQENESCSISDNVDNTQLEEFMHGVKKQKLTQENESCSISDNVDNTQLEEFMHRV